MPALVPEPDGRLHGGGRLAVPFSTPRLQGRFGPGWLIDAVAVWGGGEVASIRLAPEPPLASSVSQPNLLTLTGAGTTFTAEALRDSPCIVVDVRIGVENLHVSIKPAAGAGFRHEDEAAILTLPWAVLIAWAKGGRPSKRGLVIPGSSRLLLAFGSDEAEARNALAGVNQRALQAAEDYRTWCSTRLDTREPLLGSLLTHTLHAAASSRKQDAAGKFAGLAAGASYTDPARSYFRDGYWTSHALLPFKPEWVREQVAFLAGGVHDDGEAPSAVIVPSAIPAWCRLRKADRVLYRDHHSDREWWSDHFDSPLFLVNLVADYVALTGDRSVMREEPVESALESIGQRYLKAAEKNGGLPAKPRNDRDWADNVFRAGFVTYDSMLFLGAMRSLARLTRKARVRDRCLNAFTKGQKALDRVLWQPERGHYADYRTLDGFVEPHLAIDSLVGAWLGVIPANRERVLIDAALRLLVTKANATQPYGDWGVMACFPPYRRAADLRGKSRFAYRYHNGSDWPVWDAVLARAILKRTPNSSEWHYPLTRWWSYGLEHGWPEPVEYHAPPYGHGSMLQAWSGLAAAVLDYKRRRRSAAPSASSRYG